MRAPFSLTIRVENLDKAKAEMDRLAVGFQEGMIPALETIGELGSKYFGGIAFQSKGSQFGKPWAPLAPSTVEEKSKHWRGKPDEVRTEEMRNSFTYEVKGSASVRLYNKDPKFEYHQLGTGSGGRGLDVLGAHLVLGRGQTGAGKGGTPVGRGKNLPQRVMIGVNDTLNAIIRRSISEQVKVIIGK